MYLAVRLIELAGCFAFMVENGRRIRAQLWPVLWRASVFRRLVTIEFSGKLHRPDKLPFRQGRNVFWPSIFRAQNTRHVRVWIVFESDLGLLQEVHMPLDLSLNNPLNFVSILLEARISLNIVFQQFLRDTILVGLGQSDRGQLSLHKLGQFCWRGLFYEIKHYKTR